MAPPKGPSKPEPLKVEPPKVEPPKVEQAKVEPPKVEQVKVEQPKLEQVKVEQPKLEQVKVEQPKLEEVKVEQPKLEQVKVEQPKVEQPKLEAPALSSPTTQNAIKLAGEALLPGASLLMEGKIVHGGAHLLAGAVAKAFLGPVGIAIVIANSYASSTTGKNLLEHFSRFVPPKKE